MTDEELENKFRIINLTVNDKFEGLAHSHSGNAGRITKLENDAAEVRKRCDYIVSTMRTLAESMNAYDKALESESRTRNSQYELLTKHLRVMQKNIGKSGVRCDEIVGAMGDLTHEHGRRLKDLQERCSKIERGMDA
ncbi:MAG: hypothetical protein Pg6C_20210 [Treponemataceae bacterium]|nr:MAG: hypothetical protein Pg6C_20210 [Treponemataceae bacterium]